MKQSAMLDLAPGHKLGLATANPILLAGGVIGSGEALPPGLNTTQLGGVVVGPIQRHAWSEPPRPDWPRRQVFSCWITGRKIVG
ncbi:MAG: hypothetical protein R2932_03335 [Caldilineaceae bacterium]